MATGGRLKSNLSTNAAAPASANIEACAANSSVQRISLLLTALLIRFRIVVLFLFAAVQALHNLQHRRLFPVWLLCPISLDASAA
jgi:hypothetical protein